MTRQLLVTVLLALSTVSVAANGETVLRVGVYAYEPITRMVWECPAVANTVERRVSDLLDHETDVRVELHADYDTGVRHIIDGTVMLGRFPNLSGFWTAHPGLPPATRAAWSKALNELRVEDLIVELDFQERVATPGTTTRRESRSAIEAQFGRCDNLLKQISAAGRTDVDALFEGNPATVSLDQLAVADGRFSVPDAVVISAVLDRLAATAAGAPRAAPRHEFPDWSANW